MTVTTTTEAPVDLDVDLVLLPVSENPGAAIVEALSDTLGTAVERAMADFDGRKGATRVFYPEKTTAPRVAFLGLGAAADVEGEALRMAGGAGADVALEYEAETVACILPDTESPTPERTAQCLVEGFLLGSYRYRRYLTDDGYPGPSAFFVDVRRDADESEVAGGTRIGERIGNAACTARDLVNRSPHEKTAQHLADAIAASGDEHGYDVDTWNEERIREEGMGGLLAVNRGSFDPPTFSILQWNPENAVNTTPVVLVGKGVVFDTGGLSLKDTKDSMDMMKADMGGAATIVGVFEALADLGVPLQVVGLVPATDNRPGHRAYVPGDVIRMHSGSTVEVMNTDAEGRLLLADALSYADRYHPQLVVDVATLTGSCVVALGQEAAGVMTPETDEAAERLYAIQRAGERTGERVHPLPMYDEYEEHLESDVADLRNVGGRAAGAITAGKFLEHFVTDYPWLHVDIAGPAFRKKADGYVPKGGTGYGVRLLVDYLRNYVVPPNRS